MTDLSLSATRAQTPKSRWLRSGLVLALLFAFSCGGNSEQSGVSERVRPNLVFVLSDALRASSLEIYGYPRATAPRLAALAEESLVFEDHLVSYPGTPFSVSQMFTGRFMAPMLMDATYVLTPVSAPGDDLFILPRELRAAGYRTGIVTSHPWFTASAPALEHFGSRALVAPTEGESYASIEALSAPVEEFLDDAGGRDEPFFLYVHSMDTHAPYRKHADLTPERDPEWPPQYDLYESEIRYTDRWLGWLVDELAARGLLENTLLVFTADHGEELGEMGAGAWNWSHGYTLRRAQLHVPMVLRLPGGAHPGRVPETTRHLDLAPTLFELLVGDRAGPILERFRLDGESLAGRLGPDGWRSPPDGEPVTTPAFTWRYWALLRGDLALHYDQWSDSFQAYRTVEGLFNYPLDQPVDEAQLAAGTRVELVGLYRRSWREVLAMRPAPVRGPVVIGIPGTVGGEAIGAVTYERGRRDGAWTLDPGRLLAAFPTEDPPPIVLSTPWIPGTYRLKMRFSIAEGAAWRQSTVRVRFPGSDDPPREISSSDADEQGFVDLGTREIGRLFRIELASPSGGLAVSQFAFEPVGAAGEGGADAAVDPELEERLRALGYVD